MDAVATLAGHAKAIAGQGPESDLTEVIGLVLREHAERYPAVVAAVTDMTARGDADQAFLFGLERILDGLEALIAQRV
jgi:hypothetical protein